MDDTLRAMQESGKFETVEAKVESELDRRGIYEGEQLAMWSKKLTGDQKWVPQLSQEEWDIVNRAMKSFEGEDYNATKRFILKSEKGHNVFALYSNQNAENPTLLFASGGKDAIIANRIVVLTKEGHNGRFGYENARSRNIDKDVAQLWHGARSDSTNGAISGNTGATVSNGALSTKESKNGTDKRTDYPQNGRNSRQYRALINALTDSKIPVIGKNLQREYPGVNRTKSARMTNTRIDNLIDDSGAGAKTNYAQKWITSINPTDFLNLTLNSKSQDRSVFDSRPGDYGKTVDEYDYIGGLKKETRQTPFLHIDQNGNVIGHEGRHRMRALEKAGVQSSDIVVEFYDSDGRLVKNNNEIDGRLETIPALTISNQYGTGQTAEIGNIIPCNLDHRSEIINNYGESQSRDDDIRYSRDLDLGLDEERLRQWDELKQRYGSYEGGSPTKLNATTRNSKYADRVVNGTNGEGDYISTEEFAQEQRNEMLDGSYAFPVLHSADLQKSARVKRFCPAFRGSAFAVKNGICKKYRLRAIFFAYLVLFCKNML